MTQEETKKKIKEAGGKWSVFIKWMRGQTVGLNKDDTVNYYEYDVKRFIRYKCDPKNEPLDEWD